MISNVVRTLGGPKSRPAFFGIGNGSHDVCKGGVTQVGVGLDALSGGSIICRGVHVDLTDKSTTKEVTSVSDLREDIDSMTRS
jgi:hypothetical protein